jgi:uncharacterized protein (UPF0128 family)
VQCYSGYKADERPVRFQLGEREYAVTEILDRWYGPDNLYFKIRADDGNLYILRQRTGADEWSLEAFRREPA